MEAIVLKPLHHRSKECIGLYFNNYKILNTIARQIPEIKWSKTNKCWYVPCTKKSYINISNLFAGQANLQTAALKEYLINKNTTLLNNQKIINSIVVTQSKTIAAPQIVSHNLVHKKLSNQNQEALEKFTQQLYLKSYSTSTIKTYRNEFTQLLLLLKYRSINTLSIEDLKRYMVYVLQKEKLTENTAHSRLNALKFYFEQVLGKEKFFLEIPRPKKQLQNPCFFSQDEVTQIIKITGNIKHKTMLMLAYSTGMRVSEVVSLKVWQIDSKRMQIIVQQAKGKKDRMTALSPVLLVMLREYFIAYKPDKNGYLFAGQFTNEPYSSRSLQQVLQNAKKRAGILKPGSVHALRHSFATHLLDKGTDVTMIMKLLGHNDIKTTLRYLHVTNRDVLQIISPLDQLDLK